MIDRWEYIFGNCDKAEQISHDNNKRKTLR